MVACTLYGYLGHIGIDHNLYQLFEGGLARVPTKLLASFRGVAPKVYNIGRTEKVGRDFDEDIAHCQLSIGCSCGLRINILDDTLLIDILAHKLKFDTHMFECIIAEVTHRVLHTCSDNKVFRFIVLKHQPHALYIVLGITPVAKRGEVTKEKFVLLSLCNTGGGKCNLAGDKGLATTLALVVEEDTRATEHIICLTILLDNPMSIKLGYSIRTIGMEGGILILRNLFNLTIKFRGRGLVDMAGISQATKTDSLEDAKNTRSIYVSGELR